MRQVDLPVLLGEQVVVADLAARDGRHGLVGGEEGPREEDVLGLVGEDRDCHLERARSAVAHDDVVLREKVRGQREGEGGTATSSARRTHLGDPPVAVRALVKVLGDRLASVCVPDALGVAERTPRLEALLDGGNRLGRRGVVAEDARVAEAEVDELLGPLDDGRRQVDAGEDLTDGCEEEDRVSRGFEEGLSERDARFEMRLTPELTSTVFQGLVEVPTG